MARPSLLNTNGYVGTVRKTSRLFISAPLVGSSFSVAGSDCGGCGEGNNMQLMVAGLEGSEPLNPKPSQVKVGSPKKVGLKVSMQETHWARWLSLGLLGFRG